MRVLVLHLEGNVNNNPTLAELVHDLCERGALVTVLSLTKDHPQESTHPNMQIRLLGRTPGWLLRNLLRRVTAISLLRPLVLSMLPKLSADFLLGVDGDGIILAYLLAPRLQAPYAMVSFEIFFAGEIGRARKALEIQACRDIRFALVQDPLRGEKLTQENGIPAERLLYVPVAGRGVRKGRLGFLRQKLGIAETTRIALSIGSTSSWTLVPSILETTPDWPRDWCLVIHDRYGEIGGLGQRIAEMGARNVFLSSEGHLPSEDLGVLLGDADIGLGFYKATFDDPYTGGNLKYLGFASGKISTYLQFGVPVLSNDIGPYSDAIIEHGVGYRVSEVGEIARTLSRIPPRAPEIAERCRRFFSEYLDAGKTVPPVVDRIIEAADRRA
jgi:glycosyltransferase involved in cell wall biosynthesis